MSARTVAALLVAGWLADALARTDADVDAGIAAYEAGDVDGAIARFDAAKDRRGDRPEIAFDRGLALFAKGDTQAAQTALQRASEAEDAGVRASALYELGNLAFDGARWDDAIASYIECLRARPDHGNAKWNLEIALRRKQEEEEKKKKEQEEQQEDQEKQDDEKEDDEKQDDEKQDEQKQDEQKQDEQKQDEQKQDEQKQDEQKQDEQKQEQKQPAPLDEMDLQRALERLDEQDPFLLDRPRGRLQKPTKDY